jgi:C-terminal processing protease CtpA/Prc
MTGAFDYDASGLRLRSRGSDFREHMVIGVVEDSPAAKAGLQEGDRLMEIGGKPANSLTLGEILQMLKREGETVVLKLQRGTQPVEAKLALRQLI